MTVNVALSDDAAHSGGRLIAVFDGSVRRLERKAGSATVHPSSLMHAVSRMGAGTRYALIIFFGKSKQIMNFNRSVAHDLRSHTQTAQPLQVVLGTPPHCAQYLY